MLSDDELLSLACEFNVGPEPLLGGRPFWWRYYSDDMRHNAVTVKNMGNPDAGPDRWAILKQAERGHGSCLNKQGDWEYQSLPSSRTDEFYERCRYASVHEAIEYYRRWRAAVENFAIDKYAGQGIEISADGPLLDREQYKKVIVNYDEIPADLLKF